MVEMIESRKGAVRKEQRYDLFSNLLDANEGNASGIKLTDRELLGAYLGGRHASSQLNPCTRQHFRLLDCR